VNAAVIDLLALVVSFAVMLLLMKAGYGMGKRRLLGETEQERVGIISIETAIFGLLGLIFAFTYGGAATRFEARRAITIQEANIIGTAYLRLDLLPAPAQASLRTKMRSYATTQLAAYNALPDYVQYTAKLAQAKAMQAEIWSEAVGSVRDGPPQLALLLLPALNDMIDITVAHEAMTRVHTPRAILATLFVLALSCSLLEGYGLAGSTSFSRYLHMGGFALILTVIIYIVIDYDYPRFGFIRVDFADEVLEATVAQMK
jgi:hypothetical protein